MESMVTREEQTRKPIVLFGIQFTLSLVGIGSSHSPGCVIVGMLDTVNTIVQSIRFNEFTYALGVNWVIVTIYVPALLVSSRSTGSRPKLSRASPAHRPRRP